MIPYEFFLDRLYALPLTTRKMFGVTAYYSGAQLLFCVNVHPKYIVDRGIWVAIAVENRKLLLNKVKYARPLVEIPIHAYMVIPEDSDTFESDAICVAELLLKGVDWIGKIPKKKKKKKDKR